MKKPNPKLSVQEQTALISILETRFKANSHRHKSLEWKDVEKRLNANPGAVRALAALEATGGEPDVVSADKKTGQVTFMDCAPESPAGRRSTCYDREGWESRKEHRPENNAVDMATEMGAEILSEEDYRFLQTLEKFDGKTSSWVHTPSELRALGGALFCDWRYGRVFTYHNGAQSYYAARGFRVKVLI